MRFKFAFNKTIRGTLRVSATAVGGSDHVLSIYDNDEAFVRLLELAELDPGTMSSLKGSAELAFGSPRTPACCEEVELTEEQLTVLRLSDARRLYA
ncbi:hypothetical protein HDF16_005272 [Granulicella aggregans]|uniref:Uncharacterized protein n=1 Tax=Granulicella aggregans TaxID=474949 RepID=A0A7W7ZJV8_9BACT|nr:hypothetical protein [Granulicella aggregans]